MRFMVLACDYDGTIATDSVVAPPVIAALERCRESGRKLVLVTGRELDDLHEVFPRLELFEWVVAENGAALFEPATKTEILLATPPPDTFAQTLRRRGVDPCETGRVIVAALAGQAPVILETIHEFGLELQLIFNKVSVMVLPSGVNKASGLLAALEQMRISVRNTVAVGDAENDHMLLAHCEAGVAVANAIDSLKDRADWVTSGANGAGVTELVERLLRDDLASLAPQISRRHESAASEVDQRHRDASAPRPLTERPNLGGPS